MDRIEENFDMLLRINDLTEHITSVITEVNLNKQYYTFNEKEQYIREELSNKYNVCLVQEDNSIPVTRTVQYNKNKRNVCLARDDKSSKNTRECIIYTIVELIKEHDNILYVSPEIEVNITEWTVKEDKLQPIFHEPQKLLYSTVCKNLQQFREKLINPKYEVHERKKV